MLSNLLPDLSICNFWIVMLEPNLRFGPILSHGSWTCFFHQTFQVATMEESSHTSCMDKAYVRDNPPPRQPYKVYLPTFTININHPWRQIYNRPMEKSGPGNSAGDLFGVAKWPLNWLTFKFSRLKLTWGMFFHPFFTFDFPLRITFMKNWSRCFREMPMDPPPIHERCPVQVVESDRNWEIKIDFGWERCLFFFLLIVCSSCYSFVFLLVFVDCCLLFVVVTWCVVLVLPAVFFHLF